MMQEDAVPEEAENDVAHTQLQLAIAEASDLSDLSEDITKRSLQAGQDMECQADGKSFVGPFKEPTTFDAILELKQMHWKAKFVFPTDMLFALPKQPVQAGHMLICCMSGLEQSPLARLSSEIWPGKVVISCSITFKPYTGVPGY